MVRISSHPRDFLLREGNAESHTQSNRSYEELERRAAGEVANAGWSTIVLGNRYWRETTNRKRGSDFFCTLYHQGGRQRDGVSYQPFDCGIARWQLAGDRQQRNTSDIPFHDADPGNVANPGNGVAPGCLKH